MLSKSKLVCVTTSQPSTALTSGGGSLTTICPQTGAVQSTLRISGDNAGQKQLGLTSLSAYESLPSLALAYGRSTTNADDSYAMLVSIKSHQCSLHWKCRVPEPQLTGGLVVSPCGHYIVGGGKSGHLYVWKALEGLLLNSFPAHYQAVTAMEWCHGYLITGGADGMVHAYHLRQLVASGAGRGGGGAAQHRMMRTWSQHLVPVTALTSLTPGRFASGSQDGTVLMLEMCSGAVLATFLLDSGVTSMTYDCSGHRLVVGTKDAVVHLIDLDEYAIHQSRQLGATVFVAGSVPEPQTQLDRVLGVSPEEHASFQCRLRAHDRAVTALQMVDDNVLVSGDEEGCVRVWDLHARICLRAMHPWSAAAGAASGKASALHPVTSIRVLPEAGEVDENATARFKEWLNMLSPLQKFVESNLSTLPVMLRPKRTAATEEYWQVPISTRIDWEASSRSPPCASRASPDSREPSTGNVPDISAEQTIQRLRDELAQAQRTIQRWETGNHNNNKVARLKE